MGVLCYFFGEMGILTELEMMDDKEELEAHRYGPALIVATACVIISLVSLSLVGVQSRV